jgi:hypothetical protein
LWTTIPEQFLYRNLRISDFAFLDGFEGYDSELPIASLTSSGALGESSRIARTQVARVKSLSWRRWAASPRKGARPG